MIGVRRRRNDSAKVTSECHPSTDDYRHLSSAPQCVFCACAKRFWKFHLTRGFVHRLASPAQRTSFVNNEYFCNNKRDLSNASVAGSLLFRRGRFMLALNAEKSMRRHPSSVVLIRTLSGRWVWHVLLSKSDENWQYARFQRSRFTDALKPILVNISQNASHR